MTVSYRNPDVRYHFIGFARCVIILVLLRNQGVIECLQMAAADQQPTPQTLILGTIATFLNSITRGFYYGPSTPKSFSLESVDTFCKLYLPSLLSKS